MKDDDLEFILREHKWRFIWTDLFDRYFILIVPIFFIFISLTVTYFSFKKGFTLDALLIIIPVFILGCLLFYFILNRLESERSFYFIPLEEELNFEYYFDKLDWKITLKTDKVIIATTKLTWFSWGEFITIVLDNKSLLFNSRPHGRQPFTFNRDKVNLKRFSNSISIKPT